MTGAQWSFVNSMLSTWGEWLERFIDGQYEPETICAFLRESSHTQAGHRILCAAVPRKVWFTGYHVGRLPDGQVEAVTAWYVFHVKSTGECWTAEEKAKLLGIEHDTLRQRVSRARSKLYKPLMAV